MNLQEHAERIRKLARSPQARRKHRASTRGVDVPAEMEEDYRRLKRKGLKAHEAAAALGLEYVGRKGHP